MQFTSNVYEYIGEKSPYQVLLFFLIASTTLSPSLTGYSYVFIGATPKYSCKPSNLTFNDTIEITNSLDETQIVSYINKENDIKSKCYNHLNKTNNWQKCDGWVYSKEYYDVTLVTEWNLVCDRSHFKNLFLTLHFLGTFGVFLSGYVSDRFGRKRSATIFIAANTFFSILTTLLFYLDLKNFKLNVILFAILKFLSGFTSSVYSVAIVFVIELTGKNSRVFASNLVAYTLVFSQFVLVLIAYFIRDFRLLNLIVSLILLSINFYFWIVPESPIWLMANNKNKEAELILRRIAKSNKKENDFIDSFAKLNTSKDDSEKLNSKIKISSIKSLFFSKKFLARTSVIILNWFTIQLIFYGISFYTSNFAGNPYVNFLISISCELIAIIILQFVDKKFHSNKSFIASITFSGLLFLSTYFVSYKLHHYMATCLAMIGKLCITFCFFRMYTITAETYPTNIRNFLTSICLGIGRLGSSASPYIQLLGELYWPPFPFIFFAIISLLSAILFALFIPENHSKKLPESVEEFLDD